MRVTSKFLTKWIPRCLQNYFNNNISGHQDVSRQYDAHLSHYSNLIPEMSYHGDRLKTYLFPMNHSTTP